ncbi:MAG TPA: hypothetical protein VHC22_15875 [Pirellulales bacterium]|nr:hypothetical protein [Pirellulales bacterium]
MGRLPVAAKEGEFQHRRRESRWPQGSQSEHRVVDLKPERRCKCGDD